VSPLRSALPEVLSILASIVGLLVAVYFIGFTYGDADGETEIWGFGAFVVGGALFVLFALVRFVKWAWLL
jgi:membrane protein YdbS with pleckstrin-like domain